MQVAQQEHVQQPLAAVGDGVPILPEAVRAVIAMPTAIARMMFFMIVTPCKSADKRQTCFRSFACKEELEYADQNPEGRSADKLRSPRFGLVQPDEWSELVE